MDDRLFESEVRRVARELWPIATGGASNQDGRERDGVFETDEVIYVVEATTSTKKQKVADDSRKTAELVKKYAEILINMHRALS